MMSTVALAQDLGIETSSDLKQQLAPYLEQPGDLQVDASEVGRIHTAAVQVLYAFVLARQQGGHRTVFNNATATFLDALRLLGVLQAFVLEPSPDTLKSVENAA